jgi:lipoate-protein ligase A
MSAEIAEKVRYEAARRGMTVSDFIEWVMRTALKVLEENKEALTSWDAEKVLEEYFRKVWKEDWRWTQI